MLSTKRARTGLRLALRNFDIWALAAARFLSPPLGLELGWEPKPNRELQWIGDQSLGWAGGGRPELGVGLQLRVGGSWQLHRTAAGAEQEEPVTSTGNGTGAGAGYV